MSLPEYPKDLSLVLCYSCVLKSHLQNLHGELRLLPIGAALLLPIEKEIVGTDRLKLKSRTNFDLGRLLAIKLNADKTVGGTFSKLAL